MSAPIVRAAATVAATLLALDASAWVIRMYRRGALYEAALARARLRGKPLLVIGRPLGWTTGDVSWSRHPCGDVTIDLTGASECPAGQQMDAQDLSKFATDHFGAVYSALVIEQVDDPQRAWSEWVRVAGGPWNVFLVESQWWAPFTYWFPAHKWAVTPRVDGTIKATAVRRGGVRVPGPVIRNMLSGPTGG
jgi:hypothetical protein